MSNFVNLHVHSALGSLLDSILTVDQIVKYAADHNQTHVALTDHGTMHGFVDHVKACQKYGVRPIIGCEIYETDDYLEKNDTKEYTQPRYHLILLVAKQQGLQNLFKIVSEAATEGMYKKPRISIDWIKENGLGEGLICLTACQAGRLSKYLEDGKYEEAERFVKLLNDTFDYVSLEIQSHHVEQQFKCNTNIFNFANYLKMPYCITTDAHMLKADQLDTHSIFVEIGDGREAGETYMGCHMQDEDDVYKYLSDWNIDRIIQNGIDETAHIASMIDDDIDYGLDHGSIMPVVDIPSQFKTHEEYLHWLVFDTFEDKFGWMGEEEQQIRRERLEMELPVINALDYTDYFIMLYMIAKAADERGLPRGYSRGSGANCLCLFMLGVTQIDSVRWDLDFSRFANLGRKGSLADFDWDISKRRRKEIIDITEELFGKENVAPIATFNTLSTKVAIKDIGKVLNEKPTSPYFGQIPYTIRDAITKMIPTVKTLSDLGEEIEKDVLLKDIVGKNEALDEYYQKFPLLFKYVMELEGLPKSRGRHAAGTLITPMPVTHYCPLCLDNDKNPMIQLEMHAAMDSLGLVKMDYLGLENLDIIDDALRMSGLTWKDVDINHLDINDQEVFDKVYKDGNTIGIFQMESAEARRMCMDAKVDSAEDIVVVNAANRPGTKDSFPIYCSNKLDPSSIVVLHEDLRDLFSKTHCILLYQEQALALFRYAGFPEDQVDNARRAIGKKKKDVMESLYVDFHKGLILKGWTDEQISEIWALMVKQSEYCFNRGHAVAYGLLSYLTAYLKTHYPVQFMAALLTAKSDRVEKLSTIISDCNRMGIKVSPPKINVSESHFTAIPDKNEILFGLLAVKGIGESAIEQIIANRPYNNFSEYVDKVQDKSATIALIKAGAFPIKNKAKLLEQYALSQYSAKTYTPVKTTPSKIKLLTEWDINTEDYLIGNKVDKDAVLKLYNDKKKAQFDAQEKIKYTKYINDFRAKYMQDEFLWEYEALSMFITDNPLKDASDKMKLDWSKVKNGNKGVVLCVISDIKRKKDKHNNQFAYLDLVTPNGMLEATIWSRQLSEYIDLIVKGNCIAIMGRKDKESEHLFVEKVKSFQDWQQDVAKPKTRSPSTT